jgi:hypothetical protein
MTKNSRLYLLRIFDGEDAMYRLQHATIAHLAAGLGVERRVVEHNNANFALI